MCSTTAKDYKATAGDLIIPANTKTTKVLIPIIDDKIGESTETFTVKFSAPDNALLPSNASATVTILDNDSGSSSSSAMQIELVGVETVATF